MKLGGLIFDRLKATSAIYSVVGERIYPKITGADKPVYPYITYFLTGTQHTHNMQGSAGLAFPRVQINCWCEKFDEETLEELVEQVRLSLTNYRDLNVGFQAAIPITTEDLPVKEDSMSIGRFIEFELHLAEAAA